MSNYLTELELVLFSEKADKIYDLIIVLEKDYLDYDSGAQDLLNKIIKSIQSLKSNLTYKIINGHKFKPSDHRFQKIINFAYTELESQHNILSAPAIAELQINPALKKHLWEQLQVFCNI